MLTHEQIQNLGDRDLCGKIAEEASEVITAASAVIKSAMKHHAHGPFPYAGGVQYNNHRDVMAAHAEVVIEFAQLRTLLEEYNGRFADASRHK